MSAEFSEVLFPRPWNYPNHILFRPDHTSGLPTAFALLYAYRKLRECLPQQILLPPDDLDLDRIILTIPSLTCEDEGSIVLTVLELTFKSLKKRFHGFPLNRFFRYRLASTVWPATEVSRRLHGSSEDPPIIFLHTILLKKLSVKKNPKPWIGGSGFLLCSGRQQLLHGLVHLV